LQKQTLESNSPEFIPFTHDDKYSHLFPTLIREDKDGVRHYGEEDTNLWYPSMTTVISGAQPGKLDWWRAREGEEKADRLCRQATTRGTKLHRVIEVYLQNGDYQALDEWKHIGVQWMFQAAKFYLDTRIGIIYEQERRMISHKLKLAGTTDIICDLDRELAVGDFKGSFYEKEEEYMEDYFVQLSGYWCMFVETTGVVPRKLFVFLVAQDGAVQIVERTNIMYYVNKLNEYLNLYNARHD
jgi:hypothetical protein